MKKSLILFIVIIFLATMGFIGISCKEGAGEEISGTEEVEEVEKIVLNWTDYQAGNEGILSAYNELMEIFYEKHPEVTINYTQYSATTYEEFLKPAIAGGEAPDMFFVIQGYNIADIADAGALRDLTNDIDEEWKGWLGGAYDFKGPWYKEKLWTIPQDVYTEAIWYHKDMLEEIGWNPIESTDSFTVEDYIAMVEPARDKGYDVMMAGFIEIWTFHDPFFNFVHQQQESDSPDIALQAMNGEISWQQDIFREAINVFVKLNDGGVWRADALNMDYQIQAFGKWLERESIFMWGQGDWFASAMKEEENNSENPNIGIVQYPLVSPNSTIAFNKNMGTNIAVSAQGEHQDLVLEWIRLTSSPQAAEIFMSYGVNPAAGADINNLPKIDNPILEECIKLYNSPGRHSEMFYNSEVTAAAMEAIGNGIGEVILGVTTVDEVLAKLDQITGYEE